MFGCSAVKIRPVSIMDFTNSQPGKIRKNILEFSLQTGSTDLEPQKFLR